MTASMSMAYHGRMEHTTTTPIACRVEMRHIIPPDAPDMGCIDHFCRLCEVNREVIELGCQLHGGHKFVDDDPSDPETGPAPDVYCVECGYRPDFAVTVEHEPYSISDMYDDIAEGRL